jgi:hypothetical protein
VRETALRIHDLLSTYPGSTIEFVTTELKIRTQAAERQLYRLKKLGVLTSRIDDDGLSRWSAIADAAPPKSTKPRRRKNTLSPERQAAKRARRREASRVRRERAAAEKRCPKCMAGLMDDWPYKTCPECTERNHESCARYGQTAKGRRTRRVYAREKYPLIREQKLERLRLVREQRKVAGQCQRCDERATSDSAYCPMHLEYIRRIQREWFRAKYAQREKAA